MLVARGGISQIGAAFVAPGSGDESAAPAVTRVPAGLSCYQPAARAADGGRGAFGGMAAAPLVLPDASVSCGFGLTSAAGRPVFSLADLQLKPRAGAAPRSAAAAAAAAAPDNSMLYAVEWVAVESASLSAASAPAHPARPASARWSIQLRGGGSEPATATWRHRKATAGHGVRAVARQVQALQRVLTAAAARAAGAARGAAMAVRGLPEGCAMSPAAARLSAAPTVVALVRVAAQEVAAVGWTTCAVDAAAPRVGPAPAAADSFAVASTGGVWLSPRLMAHSDVASAAATVSRGGLLPASAAFNGTVLVSGGLGDIGLLATRWVAAAAPAARLVLLSRSGRSAQVAALAAGLAAAPGASCFTVAHCDVSSRDEVEGLVAHLRAAGDALFGSHPESCRAMEACLLPFRKPRCLLHMQHQHAVCATSSGADFYTACPSELCVSVKITQAAVRVLAAGEPPVVAVLHAGGIVQVPAAAA